MVSLQFESCSHCDRDLRNVIFCPDCGQSYCSTHCLEQHIRERADVIPRPALDKADFVVTSFQLMPAANPVESADSAIPAGQLA